MKHCNGCGETKELSAFAKRSDRPSGVQSRCRACHSRRYQDRKADYARRSRQWDADNPEGRRGIARRYDARNRGKRREAARTRRELDPKKYTGLSRKRRAEKFGVPTEPVSYQQLLDRDGSTCGICGSLIDFSLSHPAPGSRSRDHIIPMSRGGHDMAYNLRLAHLSCNMRKHSKLDGEMGEQPHP